jgi:hypothetical protein
VAFYRLFRVVLGDSDSRVVDRSEQESLSSKLVQVNPGRFIPRARALVFAVRVAKNTRLGKKIELQGEPPSV